MDKLGFVELSRLHSKPVIFDISRGTDSAAWLQGMFAWLKNVKIDKARWAHVALNNFAF